MFRRRLPNITRRVFLNIVLGLFISKMLPNKYRERVWADISPPKPLGVSDDGFSHIFVARGGSPEENMNNVLALMGGIRSLIGSDDVVIVKPNSQWWNQGMTNTNTIKEFIRQILEMREFKGEVIIADNHQYQEDESRGWTTNSPNGDFNFNQLIEYFRKRGFKNVSKYHWHCAGRNKGLVQGDSYGNAVVRGPEEGDGYVWRSDLVYKAESGRKAMMSYPVFTSHYSGITIDLKHGAWKGGRYLSRKIKLINFPGLNHHSRWAGVTCCIKNYLGIVDMSCGYHGEAPKGFFNFHHIGNRNMKLHPHLIRMMKFLSIGYLNHFHGGPVGFFMKSVRMADLNVVTANWVGYGSRTDPSFSAKTNTVLACKDPVALDYYASKYILMSVTPKTARDEDGHLLRSINDPDNRKGPFRWCLEECHREGIGNLEEWKMKIHEYKSKA